ncbi:MAG: S8 family peptidase [Ferruginibacter sp.]|nr:S8 family serine peptidase [Ferruginibacter sp.]
MNKITSFAFAALLVGANTFAQDVPKNWHQLDPAKTGYNGISLQKAYDLLKTKKLKSKRVLVAVIDSGIDTAHEDLKPILWTNPKEIPGNGIDDDKNGYIDDVHGWNFIGGKDGRNVKEDSYEAARVYHKLKPKWEGKTVADAITTADKKEFADYKRAEDKIIGEDAGGPTPAFLKTLQKSLLKNDSVLQKLMGKEVFTGNELDSTVTKSAEDKKAKAAFIGLMKPNGAMDQTNKEFVDGLAEYITSLEKKEAAKTTIPEEYRKNIVGDDESNINDRNYGNNDLMTTTSFHGTHCSGIIAAARNNKKGVDGIADNVRIMMVRAVPDGDEHDKDIANAIRYAVDNGAQIISMSFGKDFSPEKQWVDDAYRYAAKKNVLLVHAAGNDSKNVDTTYNFPNPFYIDGKGRANNIITVGASGDKKNGGLTAAFSNYGVKEVDVFAPGVNINSTIPGGNTYGNASGTSMACPVVAGVAALLLEYYPTLTALQLKEVIENSSVKSTEKVNNPETKEKVLLSSLCKTGGYLNAFEAVKYADNMVNKNKKIVIPPTKIKKTLKN